MYGDGSHVAGREYPDDQQHGSQGRDQQQHVYGQQQGVAYNEYASNVAIPAQRPGLVGPFTVSNSMNTMPPPSTQMSQMPPHSPSYGQQYHPSLMNQQFTPPYHQRPSTDAGSRPLANYAPHPGTAPSPPTSAANSHSTHSVTSSDPGYHPYSLPISPPTFLYPPQGYPASPYPRGVNYPQHFAETETQGTWWYLPPSNQFEVNHTRYHGPFAVDYSHQQSQQPQSNMSSSSSYFTMPQAQPQPQIPPTRFAQASSSVSPNQDSATPPSRGIDSDRQLMRRPYHPNPPSHRSEWVMWVGNVPSDASHDEVWRFFCSPPPDQSAHTGVSSIFLIARSSCVFVNFDTEEELHSAINMFNGVSLRPTDPRCPMLVCRVRKKDDDLKAGVGGQRGTGMHTRWVQQNKGKGLTNGVQEEQPSSPPLVNGIFDGRPPPRPHLDSTSSDSFSSTNSSMLGKYFPKRYFILKSLTQEEVDRSVQTGLWTTQRHNEGILDQAFRSSKDGVFLIFSVNKSGEFFGYARMLSPIGVETPPAPPPVEASPPEPPDVATSSPARDDAYFPNRYVEDSPMPLATPEQMRTAITKGASKHPHMASAPPAIGPYGMSPVQPAPKYSLDIRPFKPDRPTLKSQQPTMDTFHSAHDPNFKLDAGAPYRAVRSPAISQTNPGEDDSELGRPFRVEWLSTERLPFYLTRHLRNEWNKDRELKVSRDGTEVEPTVGERLISEWHDLVEENVGKRRGKR